MTSTDEYTISEKYRKPLDYEKLLLDQISSISHYRNERKYQNYIVSIETLIIMLPNELRKTVMVYKKDNEIVYSLGNKDKYDNLWLYINQLLEENNIIFKTSFIKTYV